MILRFLSPARASGLTRTYVAAFLDHHLKGSRQPLPDEPSARFPEAEHHAPALNAPA
ncbi:hypothetical protein AB0J42_03575 [Nonomuraea sp. NPDC049649]|uniref:hypothetical protein n=1 Tax=Nonomuraea sp. NPDC049649 TaxID=3155776 RepID=UPI0034197BA4